MSENAQFRLFWCMAALTLLVVALFIEVGCSDPERDYQAAKFANDTFQLKQDLAEKQATGEAKLQQIHAQQILALTPHQQAALTGQKLSSDLTAALWVLGIGLVGCLAGGFLLLTAWPSLSIELFKAAALDVLLIGLDVLAVFMIPYAVAYIGYVALGFPLLVGGVVIYEIKTHPHLLDFLYNWHLLSKAGPPDSGAIMSATIADEVQHAERTVAEVESSTAAALKRAEALSQQAGQSMIDSGTFPQQHANGLVAAESALSPKTPQKRKD